MAVFTLEAIIRLWVYACVSMPYDPSIAHLFDLANALSQSFARQYRKKPAYSVTFLEIRSNVDYISSSIYHLKVRHRMSSRSCLAALFNAGDRLTAPGKGYTINPNNKIRETVIVAQISCSRSAKLK